MFPDHMYPHCSRGCANWHKPAAAKSFCMASNCDDVSWRNGKRTGPISIPVSILNTDLATLIPPVKYNLESLWILKDGVFRCTDEILRCLKNRIMRSKKKMLYIVITKKKHQVFFKPPSIQSWNSSDNVKIKLDCMVEWLLLSTRSIYSYCIHIVSTGPGVYGN